LSRGGGAVLLKKRPKRAAAERDHAGAEGPALKFDLGSPRLRKQTGHDLMFSGQGQQVLPEIGRGRGSRPIAEHGNSTIAVRLNRQPAGETRLKAILREKQASPLCHSSLAMPTAGFWFSRNYSGSGSEPRKRDRGPVWGVVHVARVTPTAAGAATLEALGVLWPHR
jgi:hypothetical protein